MDTSEELLWTNELLINIESIDNQHKKIFNIINEFIGASRSNPSNDRFAELLSKLTDHGLAHFKEEEKYMSAHSYPKLKEHVRYHKQYIHKVAMLNVEFFNYEPKAFEDIIKFLKQWWFNHIKTMDMDYKNYIQGSPVKQLANSPEHFS